MSGYTGPATRCPGCWPRRGWPCWAMAIWGAAWPESEDSGVKIRIGNRHDEYADQARADGFDVVPLDVAAADDIVCVFLPGRGDSRGLRA